jgi:hypothetical protein
MKPILRVYFNLNEVSIYIKNIVGSSQNILNNLGKHNSHKIVKKELKRISYYLSKINKIIEVLSEEEEKINEVIEKDDPLGLDFEVIFKVNEKLSNIIIQKIKKIY